MGLVNDIIKFFFSEQTDLLYNTVADPLKIHTIADFAELNSEVNPLHIVSLCRKLESENILYNLGTKGASKRIFDSQLITIGFDEKKFEYGNYEFLVNGFPYIREHFQKAVKYVNVLKSNDIEDIGTAIVYASQL